MPNNFRLGWRNQVRLQRRGVEGEGEAINASNVGPSLHGGAEGGRGERHWGWGAEQVAGEQPLDRYQSHHAPKEVCFGIMRCLPRKSLSQQAQAHNIEQGASPRDKMGQARAGG